MLATEFQTLRDAFERSISKEMRVIILTALGCLFWLMPLAAAVSVFRRYGLYQDGFGFNYDSLPLLGIPASMIGLTLLLAYLSNRRPLPGILIVGSSSLSFVAAFCWVAIMTQGV